MKSTIIMGGGAAMRVAGKIAGTIRGGFTAFPEIITSAAFKAFTTRPITGFISSTGQPLPRVVFGGAPTLEEAQDATFQIRSALDQVYLSNESSEGSCESDMGQDKLAISDSGHFESKTCVTKASAPNHAMQAFRLLKESTAAQTVVVSVATDPNVWDAVMRNEALLEYIQSQNAGMKGEALCDFILASTKHMNGSFEESTADTGIPGYQYPKNSDDETFNEKEPENDLVYLSNESSEGSCESDMGQDKLAISDSGHFESKTCVTKASAPNHAIQAFRLLKESAAAKTVAVSVATDPNVWDAVMRNEALLEYMEYIQSQNAGMKGEALCDFITKHINGSFEESTADTGIPGYQYPKYSDDETFNEKEPENGFNSFLKDIKSRVEDMMNSLSSFIHNRFAGPATAGKIAGIVNGTIRGGFTAFPEIITSAAFKAYTTRPITGFISSTGQPLPRVVFGGPPTLEEAQDATFQIRSALDQVCLSNESIEGSCESDMGQDKLAISDSGHFESKTCVTKASAPNLAIQAFRLLKESAAAQVLDLLTVVVSVATDPNVWAAVKRNKALLEYIQSQKAGRKALLEYIQSQKAGMKGEAFCDFILASMKHMNGYQYLKYSDDETFNEKEPENGFNSFLKDIKSRVEDMMNSLSSFIHNLFADPAGESAKVEKTMGDSILASAVMVIIRLVVVLKRGV